MANDLKIYVQRQRKNDLKTSIQRQRKRMIDRRDQMHI